MAYPYSRSDYPMYVHTYAEWSSCQGSSGVHVREEVEFMFRGVMEFMSGE